MEVVPPNLTSYQKAIIYSNARFTITEASTKVGKTYSHIIWLFMKSHEAGIDHDGRNYWWCAPIYNQAKIAFGRFRRYLAHSGIYRFNESNLVIYCPNGSQIHFKSAEKSENLYGEDVFAAVFDEAPRAKEDSWYALRSTLTATEAPCKLIGNFGGVSNWVHLLKEKASNDETYEYFKITCWDAVKEGILSEKEVLQAKRDLPEKIFKELYEAEASEDEGQLINFENIRRLFQEKNLLDGQKYITADIARLGKDKTVIMVWSGFKVVYVKALNVTTIPHSVDAIKSIQRLYDVHNNNTIVDEDGVGGGVKDYLKCKGFINNARPVKLKGKEENFANLKTQCYWKLAEMINQDLMEVHCDEEIEKALSQELEWVRLPKEVDTSKISLISKERIKEFLGRSPDFSDALMMRLWFVLRPNYGVYSVK
ncbi:terminase large subunit domain-containing protein [Pareuzebyella sediminis]|uniref:terminase large subunit domain-containing protein n=1 Tax=Pareuzebyella sediminis TaxID=2607998 RepID=UPI0011EE36BA|nr:terminase family protein [Pareuzebyella sediminis]